MKKFIAVRMGVPVGRGSTHLTVDGEVTLCGTSVTHTFSLDDLESRENPGYFHVARGEITCMDCMKTLRLADEQAKASRKELREKQ